MSKGGVVGSFNIQGFSHEAGLNGLHVKEGGSNTRYAMQSQPQVMEWEMADSVHKTSLMCLALPYFLIVLGHQHVVIWTMQ